MNKVLLALILPGLLFGDFRYETTTRVTKGMILKVPFAKKPEPVTTVHYMKGGRVATVNKGDAMVIDFEKQTFTQINTEKKQYWQMTFDEMRKMMTDLQQDMNDATKGTDVTAGMKFEAKATGIEKEVGGFPAKQVIMTVEMIAQDTKKNATAPAMKMVSDSWHSEAVTGYGEYKKFYERLKDKGSWMNLGAMRIPMAGQNGMTEGMRKMAEEMQKTPGIAVLTISRVMMPGMNMPDFSKMNTGNNGDGTYNGQTPGQTVGEAAKQAGGQMGGQQAGQAIGGPLGGMLGGAMGGKLAGKFGGFGKKKVDPQQAEAEAKAKADAENAQAQAQSQAAAAAPESSDGLMMESVSDASGFSTAAIGEEVFAIPAGFTKVEPEMAKRRKK